MSAAIPLADAQTFRTRALATRVVLAALGAGAAAAAVGALLISRFPHSQTLVPLPSQASVVIVLDLSASISSDSFSRIGGALRALSRSGDRVGLVVFSEEAYEALPPGTPAADLAPMVRYFTQAPHSPPGLFPVNPWGSTFTAGTSISAGMQTAIDIAVAQRPRAAVMLVSDLDDDPNNLPKLTAVGAVARHDRVAIRIVGLAPSPANLSYFRNVFGRNTPIVEAPSPAQGVRQEQTPFPWALVGLAVAAALALALSETWMPRLSWRRSP